MYYLAGRRKNSRHLYDLYRIYPKIDFNDEFSSLVEQLRKLRKTNSYSLSARDGTDIPELLTSISEESFFKDDYSERTRMLLYEDVPYEEAASVLPRIISSGFFK